MPQPDVSLPWRFNVVTDAYDPNGVELETILSHIDFKKTHRVLEVGTGNGRMAFRVAPYVGKVYGIDVDKEILKVARARSEKTCLNNVRMVCGDISKAPFGNSFFDVVLCSWVLHHVENKDAALREIYRTLKKGGIFLSIDVTGDNDYIPLKGMIKPRAPGFVAERAERVLGAIRGSELSVISTQRFHSYYLLPTIKEVHMFFKEFDISYERLDEDFLHQFLEKRKTKGGYKISESADLTLAKKG